MNRVIQLKIDLQDYGPRRSATEQEFEEKFGDVMKEFGSVVRTAEKKTNLQLKQMGIPVSARGRNLTATLMNSYVCDGMMAAFPAEVKKFKHGRLAIIRDGSVVFFKKLDDRLKPKHVLTRSSLALENNLQPYGVEQGAVVWLGWTTNDSVGVSRIYAIHRDDNRLKWRLDVEEWIGDSVVKKYLNQEQPVSEPVIKITIKRKNNKLG